MILKLKTAFYYNHLSFLLRLSLYLKLPLCLSWCPLGGLSLEWRHVNEVCSLTDFLIPCLQGVKEAPLQVSPHTAAREPVIVWGNNADPALPSTLQQTDLIKVV